MHNYLTQLLFHSNSVQRLMHKKINYQSITPNTFIYNTNVLHEMSLFKKLPFSVYETNPDPL